MNAIAALFALGASTSASAAEAEAAAAPVADVVVISATRVGHSSFDMPAAIDVVDAARKQMIWEGVVTGSVSEHLSAGQAEAAINRALAAAFVKFPVPLVAPPATKAP